MIEFKCIFSLYLNIYHFIKLGNMIIVKYIDHIKLKADVLTLHVMAPKKDYCIYTKNGVQVNYNYIYNLKPTSSYNTSILIFIFIIFEKILPPICKLASFSYTLIIFTTSFKFSNGILSYSWRKKRLVKYTNVTPLKH